jgi:hypothetical protein
MLTDFLSSLLSRYTLSGVILMRCGFIWMLLRRGHVLFHHAPSKSNVVESIHTLLRHVLVRIRLELTALRRNPATQSRVGNVLGGNVAVAVRLAIFHQLLISCLPSLVTLALAPFESKSIEIGNLVCRQARAHVLFVILLLHALLIHPASKRNKSKNGYKLAAFIDEVAMSRRVKKRKRKGTHQTPSCRLSGYCCGTLQFPYWFLNMCSSVRR